LKTITRRQTILLLALAPSLALCADQLPEPLTLEAALNSAHNPAHFELLEIDQRLQALNAELGIEQGYNDFRLDLTGRIRQVGLSDVAEEIDVDEDGGDSAASLVLSKPLYDFGLRDSLESSMGLQSNC